MRRFAGLLVIAFALLGASSGTAAQSRPAADTKTRAEVNVLRTAALKWKAWQRYGLFDPRTHLLADNTQAVCRGRGKRSRGSRYRRFACVVRPEAHRGRQGLWLNYRALPRGHFQIRVTRFRRH